MESLQSLAQEVKRRVLELPHGKQSVFTSILVQTLVFVFAVFAVKFFWERRRLYYYSWKSDGPFALPWIGNVFTFLGQDFLETGIWLMETFKAPVRMWMGGKLFFVVSQPRHLDVVMNKALAKHQGLQFAKKIIGTGILTAPVDKWRRHRRVIQPTFNRKILEGFVETFSEHATTLVQSFEAHSSKGVFDAFPLFCRCTLNIIIETAIGSRLDSQDQDCSLVKWFSRMREIIIERTIKSWYHAEFLWNLSKLSKEFDLLVDNINHFMKEVVVQKRLEYRRLKGLGANDDKNNLEEENKDLPKKRKAFLSYLVELAEEDEEHWTDEEIMEESATIAIAGHDTTATTDCFVLIMLGMHPEIQAKAHAELDLVFGDSTRKVTPEDLPKLKYLEMVIKETLRLFPPGPVIIRGLHEDLQLDEGHILPKGSGAAMAIFHTHRDPKLWTDPLKFNPDRFLPEETANRHPYSYIPFSAGPRNCIGPIFAMMSMKSLLSTILRHYRVGTKFKKVEDVKLTFELVLKCAGGFPISLDCRNKH